MKNSSLFQSEEMTLCQLFLQPEAAYNCVSELGEIGLVQFRDLNPDVNAFQRKFVAEVRRCDDMERKLRYLEKEMKRDDIQILDTKEYPDAPASREMIDLEATLDKLESELREVNQNAEGLQRNFLELTELKHIMRKTQVFFDEMDEGGAARLDERTELLSEEGLAAGRPAAPRPAGREPPPSARLGFIAGVILREKLPAFERLLWRACRGNVFLRQSEIETPLADPSTGDMVHKTVFIIFFQGDQLKARVRKIAEGFRATVYPCPETAVERRETSIGVMTRIEDLTVVLSKTKDHRRRVLISAAKSLRVWFIKVRKIKAIYHTLNLFNLDVTQKCLIAECWLPAHELESVHAALRRGTDRTGSSVPPILHRMGTREKPPTYHRLNKFTEGFQNLVDAYGMATYREINPAPFTIITFPFLFAVMFGDIGHALIIFLFALWMVLSEQKLSTEKLGEVFSIFFNGRYIILLMGIFSFYTGLIYNDIFSKSINIFGSSWFMVENMEAITDEDTRKQFMMDPKNAFTNAPYPMGVDPVWQVSINKIAFLNAYKMKISIIIGVVHMIFGICLSLWNHINFRRSMDIYCEFIPRILFKCLIFFYLVVLIFHKWVWYSANAEDENETGPHCAPSILITFINMLLFSGVAKGQKPCNESSGFLYDGQAGMQWFLLITGLLCIPWMLLMKPLILLRRWRRKQMYMDTMRTALMDDEDEEVIPGSPNGPPPIEVAHHDTHGGDSHGHGSPAVFDFGETMIYQGIHTIEFVLESVSHTASYLRLWALSLAHAQLSDVLWSMLLHIGLAQDRWWGGIILYFIFSTWASLTVFILCLMEGLSAFLHTLRLHWVEFQSKFYEGQGHPFVPFAFKSVLAVVDELDEQ